MDFENNFIISGNDIPMQSEGENCVELVRKIIVEKLKVVVPTNDIQKAVRIGKKGSPENSEERRTILVGVSKPEIKKNLKQKCKTLRPRLYVNDDLSKEKRRILKTRN